MNTHTAIKILETHNQWRRGSDESPMGCTKELGLAIDHAIEVMKRWQTDHIPHVGGKVPQSVSLKVGQIITVNDHSYKIEGIHLGASGQESIIQMKSTTHSPGWTGPWEYHPMLFVPEAILRKSLQEPPQDTSGGG